VREKEGAADRVLADVDANRTRDLVIAELRRR
jgi:hypothetical protein